MKNSRALSGLLSTLISQLILLPLLLFPSSTFHGNIFPLIHHFLSTSELVSTLSFLSISRNRKRTQYSDPNAADEEEDIESTLGQLDRVDSVIPLLRKRKRAHYLDPNAPNEDGNPGSRLGQRERIDSVIPSSPDSFKLYFKMSSSTFEWLSGLLEPLLECRDPVDSPLNLSVESRLGIGLLRLAKGADYPEISTRFQVSEPTAKFCVKQLCRVLCTNYRFWVSFPSRSQLETESTQFENFAGLPNCCGIVTCTRFKITRKNVSNSDSNDTPQEESIAVQIIVDSKSRILSIIAGFRGENSDFRVLKSSTLYEDVEKKVIMNSPHVDVNGVKVPQYFIGNRGYPLLKWLLVPFVDPKDGSYEEEFNNACKLIRVPGLKTINSLRNWGVLTRPIEVEVKTMVGYIGACSILHNMLLMREDYSALCDFLSDSELYDQSYERYGDASFEESFVDEEALLIRNALARRAKEFHALDRTVEPDSEAQL